MNVQGHSSGHLITVNANKSFPTQKHIFLYEHLIAVEPGEPEMLVLK